MDKPIQRFKNNTRVKLRDGLDPGFYDGLGRVGSEGWIRRKKRDGFGYPKVLIEWDKDFWAYNGQEDCWTFESHFDAVEENQMEEQESGFEEQIKELAAAFTTGLTKVMSQHRGDIIPESELEELDQSDEGEWAQLVQQAQESIGDSPAYVVIALERLAPPGAQPMIIPRVFHASQEPEYALILQSQLAHVLASMQDETIHTVLSKRTTDGS